MQDHGRPLFGTRGWIGAWHRPRRRMLARLIAWTLSLVMAAPVLGWAFAPDTYRLPSGNPAPYGLELPPDLGSVTCASPSRQLLRVIHIQDLHCHYPLQQNIAALLEHLVRTRGLKLVLVEGAHLPINVTKLSSFPDPRVRQLAAEPLLKSGRMSGAEYFAALHPEQVALEGMEEAGEYRASHELALRFLTDENEGLLCDLRLSLENLKPQLYPLPLLKLDELRTAVQNGQMSLKQYCRQLLGFAQGSLDPAAYPCLLAYSQSSQAGFPANVEADDLYRELSQLDLALRRQLYTLPLQAEFDGMLRRLDLLEGLLNIALTPEELEEVRADPDQLAISRFLDFLQPLAARAPLELSGDLLALDDKRQEALAFYQQADQRSRTFAHRALEALAQHRSSLVVIVSGGYHTAQVCQALADADVGYVSVRPRMNEAVVYNPYFSLLRRRQTPLERLVARSQMQLALPPFFAQHPDPQAILAERELPEDIRQAYQMLEMMLKLGVVQQQWVKTASIRKTAAVLAREQRNYAADSGGIRFDFQRARTLGPNLMLPLAGRRFMAVMQPRARALKLPESLTETLQLEDFEISFHPLDRLGAVETRLHETQPGVFGRIALPVPLLRGFIPIGMGAVPSLALVAGMVPFINFNRLPALPGWRRVVQLAGLARSQAQDLVLRAYFWALAARGRMAPSGTAWWRRLRQGIGPVLRLLPILLAGSLGSLALQGMAYAAEGLYYVGRGDTLWGLARRFYPSLPAPEGVAKIAADNHLADPDKIRFHTFGQNGEPSAFGTTLKVDFDLQQMGSAPVYGRLVELAPEPAAQPAAATMAPQLPDSSALAPAAAPIQPEAPLAGWHTGLDGWRGWLSDPLFIGGIVLLAVAGWLAWAGWRKYGPWSRNPSQLAKNLTQAKDRLVAMRTQFRGQIHARQVRLVLWLNNLVGQTFSAAARGWSSLTARVSPLRGAVFLAAAGAVLGVGLLQPGLPLSVGLAPAVSWGTTTGLAGLLLVASYLSGRPAPIRAGPPVEDPSLNFLREQIAKRKQSRFTLWPIYGELLGDIKLAVGLIPILLHLSPTPPTWTWTLGATGAVLLALGLFTFVSNFAVSLLREHRLLAWQEVFGGLRKDWQAQKGAWLKNIKEYHLTKQQAPVAAMLAVALMFLARLLDYSTVLGYTVNFNAVTLFALAGGFLIFVGLKLLKANNRTEWLEGVVSKALRIVCAVVLIEVCKFPTSAFFVLFFGSSVLASNSTEVSLRAMKKVVGVLSFAQFLLHFTEWIQRVKRKDLRLGRRPEQQQEAKTLGQRLRASFGRGQPLRQILFIFMLSSLLLISFYLALPLPIMLAGQTVLLAAMLGEWLFLAKNPKISQQVKVIVLASLLPAALVVLALGTAWLLTSVHALWPQVLPGFVSARMLELQAALGFLKDQLQEITIFVSFMYSLLGFSSVLKDQDKVSQVSEAAPDRLHVLQATLNRYLKALPHYLRPDEALDWERLQRVCQASRVILVPKKSQPTWMASLLEGGVFSLDQEIYFRRRMFNLLSNRTVAVMVFREALVQAGLPLERVQQLVAEVTASDPQALALIGKQVLEAGNRREADVALDFELRGAAQDPRRRAEYLQQVLERRYGVRFPNRPGTYVREFNGRWDLINEKVAVLLQYGLTPHPFLFRYSREKLETAAKYIYQRVKLGEAESVKLYREALALTQQAPAADTAVPALEEEELEEIIDVYHAGQAGPRITQPRTRWQRLWFPVRPLFYRQPASPLEAWRLRQPWAGLGWLLDMAAMLLTLPWRAQEHRWRLRRAPDLSPGAKIRMLRRYGLEAHPLLLRLPAERAEQAAVYIQLRREGGAPLSLHLYREALLATRPAGWPLAAGMAEQQLPADAPERKPAAPAPAIADTRALAEAQALQAWQEYAGQDDPSINQPVAEPRGSWQRAWRWLMLALVFERLPGPDSSGGLKQPWRLAGFFIHLPLRLWRGAIWLWLASRPALRFDGEELPERRPEVAALLRQHQVPDPMALRLFARHTGLRLQTIQVRPLTDQGRRLPALFGRYREQGENGRPTLYVPAWLLRSLLDGVGDTDHLDRRWRRLAFLAKRFLLGLILEYHAQDYYQQAWEQPRLEPGDWTWTQAGVPRTRLLLDLLAGAPASQTVRQAGTRVCLTAFDLLRLADQLERESLAMGAGEPGGEAWSGVFTREMQAGAEPNFATLVGVLERAEARWDSRTGLVATALRETGRLPRAEQAWVRRDLMAALIHAQVPGNQAPVLGTEDGPAREVYVYALPETIRQLRALARARLQALAGMRATRPLRALRQRWQELEQALAGAETGAAGSLARLETALGNSLWRQSTGLAHGETVQAMLLGSDLGVQCLGVATGRLEWQEKSGVLLPVRQVVEVNSPRPMQASDLARALAPEGAQSRPYLGERPERIVPAADRRWLFSAAVYRLSRRWPQAWQRAVDRFWLAHCPGAFLAAVLEGEQSALAALLKNHGSAAGQAYLRFSRLQSEARLQAWVRSLVRVIANLPRLEDQDEAMRTLSRLAARLPVLRGVPIGTWEPEAQATAPGLRLLVPELLLKPGQSGLLGALLDRVRALPVRLDLNPLEPLRRKYFRLAGQAA